MGTDAAAGEDDDAAGGLADEPGQGEAPGVGVRRVAGRQETLAAERDDVLKTAIHIGAFVEGPVEGDFQRTRGDDEPAHCRHIYTAVRQQGANDNTIYAMLPPGRISHYQELTHLNSFQNLLDLFLGVHEIPSPGTDKNIHFDTIPIILGESEEGVADEGFGGGDATDVEAAAEFDADGTAVPGRHRISRTCAAAFEHVPHECRLLLTHIRGESLDEAGKTVAESYRSAVFDETMDAGTGENHLAPAGHHIADTQFQC